MTGMTRLLVDGTNLLHQLSPGPERQPPAALIGRLRAAIPPDVAIELVFDGPPSAACAASGSPTACGPLRRPAHGRHDPRDLVEDVAMAAGAPAGGGSRPTRSSSSPTTAPSAAAIQHRGARTAGASWLVARMARSTLSSPSVGKPAGRPASAAAGPADEAAAEARAVGHPVAAPPARPATDAAGDTV